MQNYYVQGLKFNSLLSTGLMSKNLTMLGYINLELSYSKNTTGKILLLKREPEFPVGIFAILNNSKTGKSLRARKLKK